MGTNYELRRSICDHCGQYKEEIHIGKNSWGHPFLFQTSEELGITSGSMWLDYLCKLDYDDRIYNEYNEIVLIEDFVALVEEKRNVKSQYHTLLKDGYSISNRDFC